MMVYALLLASLMLCLFAMALWMWQRGVRREGIGRVDAYVDQALQQRWNRVDGDGRDVGVQQPAYGARGSWGNWLLRAGVVAGSRFYMLAVGLPVILAVLAGLVLGPVAGIGVLILALAGIYFMLWLKIERRRKRMVLQLPGFLESMVRLITIGNSLNMAFQSASLAVDMPLREVLSRASALAISGKDLDVAMRQSARQFNLYELFLAASVVGVALRFGGRSDQVLERLAGFMRDLHQARQELHAMSAELRLSAWILALLPLSLAAFILVFNNDLFMGMWNDPVGVKMLIGAAVMQTIGCYWLYRLAKSL